MKRCTERWSESGALPSLFDAWESRQSWHKQKCRKRNSYASQRCVLIRITEMRARTHRGRDNFTYSCSCSYLRGGRHISRGWSHNASRMFPRQARPSSLSRHGSAREFSPDLREGTSPCEHIPTWISLSGDLAFSHQDGIYGFKFPKRFSELSQAMTSPLFTLFT